MGSGYIVGLADLYGDFHRGRLLFAMEQTIFQSCHYSILSKTFYTTEKWAWTPTFKDVATKATDRADEDTSLLQLRQKTKTKTR